VVVTSATYCRQYSWMYIPSLAYYVTLAQYTHVIDLECQVDRYYPYNSPFSQSEGVKERSRGVLIRLGQGWVVGRWGDWTSILRARPTHHEALGRSPSRRSSAFVHPFIQNPYT
jgi:hypothetical protein